MAIMAYLLKEYSNESIDISRVMIMCLIHDIVEIEASDTYAYDEDAKKTQQEREEKAADHLFGMLPEDQQRELRDIFEEFERCDTSEAKFARAMDNFQPLLLNDSNGGTDWQEHHVFRSQVNQRQNRTKLGSRILGEATDEILNRNEERGTLKKG